MQASSLTPARDSGIRPKIAYLSQQAPTSGGETFVVAEAAAMATLDRFDVSLVPIRPLGSPPVGLPDVLRNSVIIEPLMGAEAILALMNYSFVRPLRVMSVLLAIVFRSGSLRSLVVNLAVLPKGAWLAANAKRRHWAHIHAHWLTGTSTAAWIAHRLEDVAFSITAHRWDISERNLVRDKLKSARFVRAIDQPGRAEIAAMAPGVGSLRLLHMGVRVPEAAVFSTPGPRTALPISVLVPANLVEKKGHRYVLEALAGCPKEVRVSFAGDGPLRGQLELLARELGVSDRVQFLGRVIHAEILAHYRAGDVGCVLLPSIVTSDGQREGIPVALMEAMAHRVPVISTLTGGTSELLDENRGWVVGERDAQAIRDALLDVMFGDPSATKRKLDAAYAQVCREFNETEINSTLADWLESSSAV